MRVQKENNIYRFNNDNVSSIIEFYFFKKGMSFVSKDLDFIYKNESGLLLNELEFIAKTVSDNLVFFKDNLSINGLTTGNLMQFGIDAYIGNFTKKTLSVSRRKLTKEFSVYFN